MSSGVEFVHFWEKLTDNQQQLMMHLNELLENEFQLSRKMRFKLPFYFKNSWICYLNPLKNGALELAFTRANELPKDLDMLDFKDRKQVGSFTFFELSDELMMQIRIIMSEATLLDQEKEYASKRPKKSSK
jgi:hypothetical protein